MTVARKTIRGRLTTLTEAHLQAGARVTLSAVEVLDDGTTRDIGRVADLAGHVLMVADDTRSLTKEDGSFTFENVPVTDSTETSPTGFALQLTTVSAGEVLEQVVFLLPASDPDEQWVDELAAMGDSPLTPTYPQLVNEAVAAVNSIPATITTTLTSDSSAATVVIVGRINAAINALVNGAPGALNTLKEIADQLAADEGAASSVAAALATHAGRTDNPHATTKAQVGLGSVDNTSDMAKPVSTAQAAAIATAISNLVAGAPGALDTLNELAVQLGSDENAAGALATLVSGIRGLSDSTFLTGLNNAFARLSGVQAVASANGALVVGTHNPVDATSGNRTMTLADAASAGLMVAVSKKDATANTVAVSVAHLRDGGAGTITLVGQHEALLLTSKADGTWWPVGDHKTKAYLDATYLAKVATASQDVQVTGSARPALRAGSGAARGAPSGTIMAATNGAGAITATRRYAYTELDGFGGETLLSPVSTGLALSGQRAKLTVPPIRAGMTDRVVYASDDAGSTWHKLGVFNVSGNGWAASTYLDNNASLTGAAAPTVDSTHHWQMSVGNDGMAYFRRTDAVSDVSDMTVLMGNPANSGSLSIDAYGQLLVRGGGPAGMPGITAQVVQSTTGGGSAFQAYFVPDDGVGSPVQTFRVTERGAVNVAGPGFDMGGALVLIDPGSAAQTAATGGLLRVVVPSGSSNHGIRLNNLGTGDTINTDDGKFRVLPDGTLNLWTSTGTSYIPILQAKRLLTAPTSDVVHLTFNQLSGQTSNFAEWYNSTPTRLGRIASGGGIELTPQSSLQVLTITPAVAVTTTNLVSITLPASSTAAGITVTNGGSGDTFRSGDGKFRVLADGSINGSTGSGSNFLPDLRVVTRLWVGSGLSGLLGTGNLAIANTGGAPGTPTGGGVIYVQAGALKYIGSSGTVTTLAPA